METGMKRTVRYAIVLFLSIEVLTQVLAPSLTAKAVQQVRIGVYPGDSFTYGTPDGSPWVQTYPSGAPPQARWAQFVNCLTLSFTIINYSNPNSPVEPGCTFNETVTFRNGTAPLSVIGYVDLYFGAGLGRPYFISSGLNARDYVYLGAAKSGNYTWYINATGYMSNWPGVPVCILNYTSYTPYENQSSPLIAQRSTFVWDQRTGILLGVSEEAYGYSPSTGITIQGGLLYELIANNRQIPTDYPGSLDLTPIYVSIAIGGVVVLGVVIVRAVQSKPKGKFKRLKEG
jgi:hypothetical protein